MFTACVDRDTQSFKSAEATAKQLGVPLAWLRAQAESGDIPSLRVGRRVLFNLPAVKDALLERSSRDRQVAT